MYTKKFSQKTLYSNLGRIIFFALIGIPTVSDSMENSKDAPKSMDRPARASSPLPAEKTVVNEDSEQFRREFDSPDSRARLLLSLRSQPHHLIEVTFRASPHNAEIARYLSEQGVHVSIIYDHHLDDSLDTLQHFTNMPLSGLYLRNYGDLLGSEHLELIARILQRNNSLHHLSLKAAL